jgi:hypothetical protein
MAFEQYFHMNMFMDNELCERGTFATAHLQACRYTEQNQVTGGYTEHVTVRQKRLGHNPHNHTPAVQERSDQERSDYTLIPLVAAV